MSLTFDAALTFPRFGLEAAFNVATKETVVLVGANGSGKSTCLQLIAGHLRPDRARIALGDRLLCDTKDRVDLPPERRRIGLVFQDGALFPHCNVEANVRYGAQRPEAAREWLERLDLAALAHERVDRLSGGQRARVALARTLASEPEALLLDEPLASFDVRMRGVVRRELRDFLASVALPTIFVTHDPIDAFMFADRVVVLEEGRVTQVGTREDLLRRPRTAFVAELAGRNFIRAQLDPGEGLRTAHAGSLVLHVLTDAPAGEAFLSFLPSDVALSGRRPEGSPQNVFAATVREIVPLPDRVRVVLDAGAPLLCDITREAVEALAVAPGTQLWATVKSTAIEVGK